MGCATSRRLRMRSGGGLSPSPRGVANGPLLGMYVPSFARHICCSISTRRLHPDAFRGSGQGKLHCDRRSIWCKGDTETIYAKSPFGSGPLVISCRPSRWAVLTLIGCFASVLELCRGTEGGVWDCAIGGLPCHGFTKFAPNYVGEFRGPPQVIQGVRPSSGKFGRLGKVADVFQHRHFGACVRIGGGFQPFCNTPPNLGGGSTRLEPRRTPGSLWGTGPRHYPPAPPQVPQEPQTLQVAVGLADMLQAAGDIGGAAELLEDTFDRQKRLLGALGASGRGPALAPQSAQTLQTLGGPHLVTSC